RRRNRPTRRGQKREIRPRQEPPGTARNRQEAPIDHRLFLTRCKRAKREEAGRDTRLGRRSPAAPVRIGPTNKPTPPPSDSPPTEPCPREARTVKGTRSRTFDALCDDEEPILPALRTGTPGPAGPRAVLALP